jgi:predicted ATPase
VKRSSSGANPPPLAAVGARRDRWGQGYPFNLQAFEGWERLEFPTPVTFFVGENGSGKSTLLEAIARALDFPLEGGSQNMVFHESEQLPAVEGLAKALRLQWAKTQTHGGFFLRAESMHHVATYLDEMAKEDGKTLGPYGGRSLHQQSHGESFLATVQHRCQWPGIYLFDEPEAALSPARQLVLLAELFKLTQKPGRQFIIATHSPLLLALPGATIQEFSEDGIVGVRYEQTASYIITRDFMAEPARILRHLLSSPE